MRNVTAPQAFRDGLAALERGESSTAARRFRLALSLERERRLGRRQLEYLSWFSLSTAMAHGVTAECIRACETAARRNQFDPEMQLNLGRVYLLAGRSTEALDAFERGLRLSPGHAQLRSLRDRSERRAAPVIGRLARAHPINRLLGHVRHAVRSLIQS